MVVVGIRRMVVGRRRMMKTRIVKEIKKKTIFLNMPLSTSYECHMNRTEIK
jgi:hypothetical protein